MSENGFSLKALLAAVTLVGVGVFALLNASSLWLTLVDSATLLVLLTALLSVACRPSPRRAFWLGFTIFGWGYLLLANNPLRDEARDPLLPTHVALEKLHEAVSREITRQLDAAPPRKDIPEGAIVEQNVQPNESGDHTLTIKMTLQLPLQPHFTRIGHYLWAWLFALAGGLLASRFYLAQERHGEAPTQASGTVPSASPACGEGDQQRRTRSKAV